MAEITEPGAYPSLSAEDYHDDPCPAPSLSSSVAKILLSKSPRHAWAAHPRLNPGFEFETRPEFDIGTAFHELILGGDECWERFVVIEARDFRTKAAKEVRDAAYLAGKTPLLERHAEAVRDMASAFNDQIRGHLEETAFWLHGVNEQTVVWREGDIWCRCRPDNTPPSGPFFRDIKTTGGSAEPDAWARQAFMLGYDVQDAFYRRGIRAVLGIANPVIRFVVVEKDPPHALSVVQFDPGAMAIADRKVEAAINLWRTCLERDEWPGYPARIAHVEAPAYHERSWLEREDREQAMKADGRAYFDLMLRWQAPIEPREAAE